uniref:Uncharacterized protein n=1 Tax=Romanomermis culicivorax TaxID=13658 RepID=A0A915I1Q3_ROMCU
MVIVLTLHCQSTYFCPSYGERPPMAEGCGRCLDDEDGVFLMCKFGRFRKYNCKDGKKCRQPKAMDCASYECVP